MTKHLTHDPRTQPEVGDSAFKGRTEWTITGIDRHLFSDEIAYLHIRSTRGRKRSTKMEEWLTRMHDHRATPPQMAALTDEEAAAMAALREAIENLSSFPRLDVLRPELLQIVDHNRGEG